MPCYISAGECDVQFSFRVRSINKLINLLESDFRALNLKRATYNGCFRLSNITKSDGHNPQKAQRTKTEVLSLFNSQFTDDL